MSENQSVKIIRDVQVPMRDGIILYGDLYRPNDEERYPVVIMRTPYGKKNGDNDRDYSDPYKLAVAKYNVLIQDVRGTGASGGTLDSTGAAEIADGYDTVEWAAVQEWSDGSVGMFGLSYFGFTQLAAAADRPPHLKAICPFQNSGLLPFSVGKSLAVGPFHLVWIYGRCLERLHYIRLPQAEKERLKTELEGNMARIWELLRHRPLRETPAAFVEGAPELQQFIRILDRVDDPIFWNEIRRPLDFSQMDVAMLHLSGWHDMAKDGTIGNYMEAVAKAETPYMKQGQKLVIGPWEHGGSLSAVVDHVDYGTENSGAGRDIAGLLVRWFDYYLKGIDNGIMNEAPITLFITGDNIWREEQEWPLARTVYTDFFLHSGGRANTLNGDGLLNTSVPEEEKPDAYVYAPSSPCPSQPDDPSGARVFRDRSSIEQRDDVLVYTTEPLASDVEATGPVELKLYASTDAVDTDFASKLVDVHPDGKAYALTGGIVRLRHRNGFTSELVTPGRIYEVTICLGNIGHVFKAGHRIRLEVTSSDYPAWNVNDNTGEKNGTSKLGITARQTVYHDSNNSSKLVLPIIPRA